ncbi:uncharacterized protein CLUP02_14559 [Colletotrichum lupini]|uniref:Uncharacterized protein n=1 Tax=Colletotrichum lupini TaxID=145971 RepID=A0A9Q8WMU6_9PEZI|nr:uncharacterized protein CLUP02_14559 [Colletotrichum lupini]UQC89031.1 hypothetical protein CLUP02_14559 [Colletotrichum lupini]
MELYLIAQCADKSVNVASFLGASDHLSNWLLKEVNGGIDVRNLSIGSQARLADTPELYGLLCSPPPTSLITTPSITYDVFNSDIQEKRKENLSLPNHSMFVGISSAVSARFTVTTGAILPAPSFDDSQRRDATIIRKPTKQEGAGMGDGNGRFNDVYENLDLEGSLLKFVFFTQRHLQYLTIAFKLRRRIWFYEREIFAGKG